MVVDDRVQGRGERREHFRCFKDFFFYFYLLPLALKIKEKEEKGW